MTKELRTEISNSRWEVARDVYHAAEVDDGVCDQVSEQTDVHVNELVLLPVITLLGRALGGSTWWAP